MENSQSLQPVVIEVRKGESLEKYLEDAARKGGFEFSKGRAGNKGERIDHQFFPKLNLDSHYTALDVTKHLFYNGELIAYINRDKNCSAAKEGKQYAVCVRNVGFIEFYANSEDAILDFVRETAEALKPYGLSNGGRLV